MLDKAKQSCAALKPLAKPRLQESVLVDAHLISNKTILLGRPIEALHSLDKSGLAVKQPPR